MLHVWLLTAVLLSNKGYAGVLADEGDSKSLDEIIDGASKLSAFSLESSNDTILVGGDMLYTPEQWKYVTDHSTFDKRKGIAGVFGRWDNNIIPYELISRQFSIRDQRQIYSALEEWNEFTCVQFERREDQSSYIYITDGGGCSSRVGKTGGRQKVSLGNGCRIKRLALHELGHVIGLHHEQCRFDRNEHVTINHENVKKRMEYNFIRYTNLDDQGVAYDYSSIMHYGRTAFSKNGEPTIVTKDPVYSKKIGLSKQLAFSDIKIVNLMYKCGDHCGDTSCPDDGYMDKDCVCQCKTKADPYVRGSVPIEKCPGWVPGETGGSGGNTGGSSGGSTGGGNGGSGGGTGGGNDPNCKDTSSYCKYLSKKQLNNWCNDASTSTPKQCCKTCQGHFD